MTYQKASSWRVLCASIVAGILLQAAPVLSQTAYTIMPTPFQTALDNSGNIIVSGCIWTYAAGTTTPITTYSNNSGSANSNPIQADFAGRFTAYLIAGTNYKFVYESACSPPSHGTTLRTADNIAGSAASSATTDVTGIAGETISAGQCAYLSDGSGGKTSGSWFKCDTANAYSNGLPVVGMAPAAITSGNSGTIRIAGPVTGLSALSVGADYFVGSSGAISATIPNGNRYLGRADTTTSLVLAPNPRAPFESWADDFRLSLTTGTCVTSSDVTAATTLYLTPCYGNRIDLPDASGNPSRYSTAQISIAVPATTATVYSVFVYSNAGTPALELAAWTNDTTPGTAAYSLTNGRYFKTTDTTRMFVGLMRTTAVSGQTEDSAAKRHVWNMYNRATREIRRIDSTATWTYTTATLRQANAAAANQLDLLVGIQDTSVTITVIAHAANTGSTVAYVSVGQDSTSAAMSNVMGGYVPFSVANVVYETVASVVATPAVGRHFYAWLEESAASGTTTWSGTTSVTGMPVVSGIFGVWQS